MSNKTKRKTAMKELSNSDSTYSTGETIGFIGAVGEVVIFNEYDL